jgi:shikimate kinase
MARLVLVGLPGAGKTTLGRLLAERWACGLVDTDDVLADLVGVSAPQYLREWGEPSFRERELDALRQALDSHDVVSTGAGIVTTSAARELLAGELTLWLDADDEVLVERVRDGERPLLGDDHRASLARLRVQREPWYREVARGRVDSSGSPDEVVALALDEVRSVTP